LCLSGRPRDQFKLTNEKRGLKGVCKQTSACINLGYTINTLYSKEMKRNKNERLNGTTYHTLSQPNLKVDYN